MRLAQRILPVLWLVWSACGVASAAVGARAASFPLSIVDNRPFVDVTVDGQGPFSFILDTGSSSSTLSAALAEKLRLPRVNAGTGTGAGEQALAFPVVHVNDLSIGPFSIGALDAPAMDVSALSQAMGFRHFDGVLGVEIFQGRILTLDAARRELIVQDRAGFEPPADAIRVPFVLDEQQMPVLSASVAGVKGAFQVDTGDRFGLTLFGGFWRAHRMDAGLGATVEAMTGYGGGGPIRALVGRPARFSIGGLAVPAPVTRLSLQRAGAFTRTDRAGSIGMAVLKRFRVSFDYARREMWLSKSAAFDAPDRYDRSGMWLGLAGERGGLRVVDVVTGGPAAAAGIAPGDLVEQVGGVSADASTLADIRAMLQSPDRSAVPVVVRRADTVRDVRVTLRDLISR